MGQKIDPNGFRLGVLNTWNSRWFADGKRYKELLLEDVKLRESLRKKLKIAGVSNIEIERSINKLDIIVHVAKPGLVIGRGGTGMEDIKKYLLSLLKIKPDDKNSPKVDIRVEPIKEPNLDAYLVATNIADQLAKRMPYKRVMAQSVDKVMSGGAKGVKIMLAGRVAGAEIKRVEKDQAGTLSLQTLREKIDFACVPSLTKSGYIGVKVWICRP
jgi:small subunit ribosomal protein S3